MLILAKPLTELLKNDNFHWSRTSEKLFLLSKRLFVQLVCWPFQVFQNPSPLKMMHLILVLGLF